MGSAARNSPRSHRARSRRDEWLDAHVGVAPPSVAAGRPFGNCSVTLGKESHSNIALSTRIRTLSILKVDDRLEQPRCRFQNFLLPFHIRRNHNDLSCQEYLHEVTSFIIIFNFGLLCRGAGVYIRHGTTLFAALNVLDGAVIGQVQDPPTADHPTRNSKPIPPALPRSPRGGL
jgi:hypothetical protein